MIKLGYQGIIGSNSEQAAKEIALTLNIDPNNIQLIPCMSSINVINSLISNEVDYGIVARYNNIGGTVIETDNALKNLNYSILAELKLKISHCLCMNLINNEIKTIYGHVQALKQCSQNLSRLYPHAKLLEYPDTALAGKDLKEGKFDSNTAVLTTFNASKLYNLNVLHPNLSNSEDNYTTFILIQKEQ